MLTFKTVQLMIFVGFPKDSWKDYLYNSIDDITDPHRPLAKWLQSNNILNVGTR